MTALSKIYLTEGEVARMLGQTTIRMRALDLFKANPPALIDRRRKAMIRLLERGDFLSSAPQGSA